MFKSTRRLFIGMVLGCTAAQAQVPLPNIQVQLPPIQVDPSGALNSADALAANRLRDLRRLRVRELLRTQRRELEADPNGAPAVRAEITAHAPSDASLQRALDLGFSIAREMQLPGLDIRIAVLTPPNGLTTRAALRRLRRADPSGSYDYNHVYIESGMVVAAANANGARAANAVGAGASIGLIDTGIASDHPTLRATHIETHGCARPVPAAHGTAVASLLVGDAESFSGAAPRSKLFAADVYCGQATGGSVDKVAAAFAWLAANQVPVINVSLVGPANVLLENIVAAMLKRGHIIVAAVGNDGPAAPPLYPAAYSGVVGVTGIDAKRRALLEAARGKHVYLAAPGADMSAAGLQNEYVAVRGTSFAAPIVAGLLAQRVDQIGVSAALDAVTREAIDLGKRGVDKVYGHGLVGESLRTTAAPQK